MEENAFLRALLEATEYWEADERPAQWDGMFLLIVNTTGLQPPLLGDLAHERIRLQVVDDLAERGDLRCESPQGKSVERKFALTAAGQHRARAIEETRPHTDAVDLSWPILQTRLDAFVKRYELAGAPERGLQFDKASPHLRILLSTGYVEETHFRTAHQTFVRPTAAGLAQTRAWPSAQRFAADAVDELLLQLADRSGSEATALRTALAAGRDLLIELLATAIAKQSGLG